MEVGLREFVELMLSRSVWLGVIELSNPKLCPGFFEVDLAPYLLRPLRRDDGRCGQCDELMKGAESVDFTLQCTSGLQRSYLCYGLWMA